MDLSTLNSLTSGLLQLGNGIANASAQEAYGNFQASQYSAQAEMAGLQATSAIQQGQQKQTIEQEHTAQLSGEQQASEAAQGVDVKSGTAAITKTQTGDIGGLNYLTIGNNAALKSLGFQLSQVSDTESAAMAKIGANFNAGQSIYKGEISLFDDTMKGISHLPKEQNVFEDSMFPPDSAPTPSGGTPNYSDEPVGGVPMPGVPDTPEPPPNFEYGI